MLMARKNLDVLYVLLILVRLKSNSSDFERLCNDVSKIQQLTQSEAKGHGHEKEVHLPSVDSCGTFNGKCRNCGKVCRYWAKECKQRNGILHSETNESKAGNTGNDGSNKTCILLRD